MKRLYKERKRLNHDNEIDSSLYSLIQKTGDCVCVEVAQREEVENSKTILTGTSYLSSSYYY